ncbi:MAG: hypothetical protein JW912_07590 [Sedimentisphaerales bacterium]|nr:hypothetical protein [Sedimentisphaerales bacterium]
MIEITELTMDGTVQIYTVPDETHSLALHAVGGDITMKSSAGGDGWTIRDSEKECVDTRTISGEKIYFIADAGVKLQIRRLTGLLS